MNFFLERISFLQKNIKANNIDAVLLSYSRSSFYYAGTTHPVILIITPNDCHMLIIRGLPLVMAETTFSTDKISQGRGYKDVKKILLKIGVKSGNLALELDILHADQYLQIKRIFSEFKIVDIAPLIFNQRRIKSTLEINFTKEACRINHCGHLRILEVLREGMTELELSAEIERAHRKAGHEGYNFMRGFDIYMGTGILSSGNNLSKIAGKIGTLTGVGLSPSIPMGPSNKIIQKGEMIVADFATHHNGYHSDQSRTYVLGKPSSGCVSLYNGMKEIADRIIDILKPGMKCDHIYKTAFEIADQLGLEPYFMRLGNESKPVTFIGHGVGLEVNEPPLISKTNNETIEEGMVLALELEMRGSAGEVVKLEDTILVRSNGVEILTLSPRTLFQID